MISRPRILSGLLGVLVVGCALPSGRAPGTTGQEGSGSVFGDRPILEEPENVPDTQRKRSDTEAVLAEMWLFTGAQIRYEELNGTYARSLGALENVLGYYPAEGIRVRIIGASGRGVSAVGSRGTGECAVYLGEAAPPKPYVGAAGNVECES